MHQRRKQGATLRGMGQSLRQFGKSVCPMHKVARPRKAAVDGAAMKNIVHHEMEKHNTDAEAALAEKTEYGCEE